MNLPQAVEKAFADIIKAYPIGGKTMLRCWHIIRNDYKWNAETDRAMPCVDLRAANMALDGGAGKTGSVEVQITAMSQAEDDQDHAVISGIEAAVSDALGALYSAFRASAGGAKYTAFKASVETACTTVKVNGVTMGPPQMPFDNDGINTVIFSVTVHCCRTDF